MSFITIIMIVLAAIVILAILSVFFKALIALLPVGIVVALGLWLYYRFYYKKHHEDLPSSGTFSNFQDFFQGFDSQEPASGRKHARNVTTKDVKDDDQED